MKAEGFDLASAKHPEASWALWAGNRPIPTRILMHLCCGPCTEWPLLYLRTYGIEPEGYFYNPNIQPQAEWERRLEGLATMAIKRNLHFVTEGASEEVAWLERQHQGKAKHCGYCYARRLQATAHYAKTHGHEAFTTSLLVSPYQDRAKLVAIGEGVARQYGLCFLPFDFRPGFTLGQKMAKEDGLYRQRYCGCLYSLKESHFASKISRELGLDVQMLPDRGA